MKVSFKMISQTANTAVFQINVNGKFFICSEVYSDDILVRRDFMNENKSLVTNEQNDKLNYIIQCCYQSAINAQEYSF